MSAPSPLSRLSTTPTATVRRRTLLASVAASALFLASCGSGSSSDATEDSAGESSEAVAGIEVDGAWSRTSAMAVDTGVVYFTITSGADDVLIGASVDASIAGEVQIHETTMVDMSGEMSEDEVDETDMAEDGMSEDEMSEDDHADHMDDEMSDDEMSEDEMSDDMAEMEDMEDMPVMQMVEVGRLDLPAGEAVVLEPGGLHIMLLELAAPLELGATFDVTLDFETADDMVVTVEVLDEAPTS